ncbi:MAG: thioredoxin [Oscillospiraceae bacterium]|nr:thioredoxin [Oscillospiraceae bacterium]
MAVLTLTTMNFDEVIAGEKKVLVDFWAPWCGPCRMVSPIVDEIAEENDAFLVGKVNVDNEGELASRYGVMSIPTLMVFQNGELINQALGAMPKEKILSLLD